MSDRLRQLRRTWQVIALLRSCGGVSLHKLATETGVSTRTIRRDLEALEAAGIPITRADFDDGGGWRLIKGAPCPICGRATLRGDQLRRELELVHVSVAPR